MADIWINILGNASKLKGELDKAGKNVTSFSDRVAKIGKIATVAGTAVTGAFTAIVLKTAQAGDQFDKMSLRTGVAVEDLSSLAYAADICGTDIGTLEIGVKGLTKTMDDASKGMGEGKEAFEELGISVIDVEGNLRPTIDMLKEAATKIAAIENPTKQAALAMDIFGARAGPKLLPLLKEGGAGIEELMNKAKELGITMTTEAATAAAVFTDRMTDLKGSFAGAGRMIGDTLIPAITPLIEKATEIVSRIKEWAEENAELTEKIFKWGAALGVALMVLGPIAMILPSLITGVTLLSGAFLPFAVTAGIVLGIKKLSEYLKDVREEAYATRMELDKITLTRLNTEIEKLSDEANELQRAMAEDFKWLEMTTEEVDIATVKYLEYKTRLAEMGDQLLILYKRREELIKAEKEGIDVTEERLELDEEAKKLMDELAKKLEEQIKATKIMNALKEIENNVYKLTHTAMEISIRDLDLRKQAYIDLGIEIGIVDKWYNLEIKTLFDLNKSVFRCGQAFMKLGKDVEIAGDKLPIKSIFKCGQAFMKLGEDVEVFGDSLPKLGEAFITLDNTAKPVITAITSYLETQLVGAISNLLNQTEDFEWSWSTFWEGLKTTLINAVSAMIAKLIVLASFKWLFTLMGWPLGLLGLEKGGEAGYQFGGEVKKFQFGGVADSIPARLTIGEYVIAKPMTDFIRRFKAIPQNLVNAVVGGLPTPAPAFASGGPVSTSNINRTDFGETKIYVDIHDNKISDDVDIRHLANIVSNEILRKVDLNKRH